MTSPEQGAQQECKSTRPCSRGRSRIGRSNSCDEKAEDIELLVEHDHPGVNRDKIAQPPYWRFRSHIWCPARVDLPMLAASRNGIEVHPRRHVLKCHLATGLRALQPDSIRSMNLSIVDHALAKKIPALIAFKSQAPNYPEWSCRTNRENRNLRIRRLGRKILERFVVDGGRFHGRAACEQKQDSRRACKNQSCTRRAHER
jgi:hypothetical protein